MATEPIRVLHVEDNRGDAVLLHEALAAAGGDRCALRWEQTLEASLAILARDVFDAILLDLTLPDSRGLGALTRMRAAAPTAAILIVTGVEDESLAMEAIRQGAQDYLVKGAVDGRGVMRAILYAVDRQQAEQALRERERREKEIEVLLAWGQSAIDTINAMREGVALLEMDGTISSVNPAVERLAGLAGGAMVGRNVGEFLREFLAGADLAAAREGLAVLRNGGIPELPPLMARRPDGKHVKVLSSVSLMEAPESGRQVVVVTLKDVTDLHETTERLRELSLRLASAEEEDRWRISRYIHDTIVQNLSLSCIRLGSLQSPIVEAGLQEEAGKLGQIRELIHHAIDECRMVMSDLTPALLYELGLVPALEDLAHQLKAKHGARMTVEDDGQQEPMAPALRGLLFQSVRELVMNALKHAGPCDIRVALSHAGGCLVISVEDNGKGFEPHRTGPHPSRKGGFGMFNIRQRLEGMGGRLDIASTPGRGTQATIAVPMGEEGGAGGRCAP